MQLLLPFLYAPHGAHVFFGGQSGGGIPGCLFRLDRRRVVWNSIIIDQMPSKKESISNWIESSNYDLKTAEHMFKTGRYVYVLFMCHLAVEKLLKALYEATLDKVPPKTHNLVYLQETVNVELPEGHLKTIESLNDLSVVTRYPEDMRALVKAFRKERVDEYLKRTRSLVKWLKRDPKLKK
jgi:HEPN domain-containing protein